MAYIVPKELPTKCNHCPFGACFYSKPDWRSTSINNYDGKEDKPGTHGFRCQAVSKDDEHRRIVLRADYDEDIDKPDWCPLKDVDGKECG